MPWLVAVNQGAPRQWLKGRHLYDGNGRRVRPFRVVFDPSNAKAARLPLGGASPAGESPVDPDAPAVVFIAGRVYSGGRPVQPGGTGGLPARGPWSRPTPGDNRAISTPAATDTLSEPISPRAVRRHVSSQVSRVNRRKPRSSLPNTRSHERSRSTALTSCSACSEAPNTQRPAALAISRPRLRLAGCEKGTTSSAPEATS